MRRTDLRGIYPVAGKRPGKQYRNLTMGGVALAALVLMAASLGNLESEKSQITPPLSQASPKQTSSVSDNLPHQTIEPSAATTGTPAHTGAASEALETLPVKGRAPKTRYSREEFGERWADIDHNGCNTRNDILNRDLTGKTWRGGTHNCVVLTGTLQDPYSGQPMSFDKSRPEEIQIDHVVALSDAWQKGAQGLTAQQRETLANDPLNLLAVNGRLNQKKSAGDAATWLPPDKAYRCEYVARQIAVKAKYHLWVTTAEHDAMARILGKCPGQALPADSGVVVP